MINWKLVYGSSNVTAIGYDAETKQCRVQFVGGAVYTYFDVTPEQWEELQHTESKGRYVQIVLRRAHKYQKEGADGGPTENQSPRATGGNGGQNR